MPCTDATVINGKINSFKSDNVCLLALCHYAFYQSIIEILITLTEHLKYVPDAAFNSFM